MMYDMIIMGAGPAATAAAIHGVSQGLKVVMFERDTFPRQRPGETLHPGAESLLKQLGVFDAIETKNFIRHPGIYTRWENKTLEFRPYQTNTELAETWYGFQAHRPVFDTILLERAKELGVSVNMPCKVDGLEFDRKTQTVQGIYANNQKYTAKYVIDATGSWQYLARKLKLPIRFYSKKLYATYGYFSGSIDGCDGIPILEADNKGWSWIALVSDQLYQYTRLSFDETPSYLDSIPERLKHLSLSSPLRNADVSWRMVETPAGSGYFLVGDAGVILDPASSHGILRALMTGIKAADLVASVKANLCDEEVAIHEYTRWLREWCFHDIQALHKLYLDIDQSLWRETTINC